MPDFSQEDAQRQFQEGRARRLSVFKEGLAEGTAAVQADAHKAGISPFSIVEYFVNEIVGKHRDEWIAVINSTPAPYVDVIVNNNIVERRPITSNPQQNNWALTRNLMNVFTAQPLFASENVMRAVLGQPLKLWGM